MRFTPAFFLRSVVCLGCYLVLAVLGTVLASEIDRPLTLSGVTAHRGDSGAYVENTMPAFRSALATDADWLECDIFLTADNQIMVTHDLSTTRLTGEAGNINELTYQQILRLDTAVDFRKRNNQTLEQLPPHRMPLLRDVIELVMQQNRVRLSIQPKDGSTAAAIALIREMGAEAWIGFNDGNLQKMSLVKELAPEIPVFWDRPNTDSVPDDISIALEQGFESLVYNQGSITQQAIDQTHAADLEFGVWTVNDPDLMEQFIAMGVDRLYTDFPAKALRLFQANN